MRGALLALSYAGWVLMLGAVVLAVLTPGFSRERRFQALCCGALLIVAVLNVAYLAGGPVFWLAWRALSVAGVVLAVWGLLQNQRALFRVGLAMGLGLVLLSILKNLADGAFRYIWLHGDRLGSHLLIRLFAGYVIGLLFYSSLLVLDISRDAESRPYAGGGPRRFCQVCGASVDSVSAYCNNCGSVIRNDYP